MTIFNSQEMCYDRPRQAVPGVPRGLDTGGTTLAGERRRSRGVIYVFAEYALDTQRYELRRRGVLCPLEPQGFNVLVYLV
jgi:hypothetical protein